MPEGSIVLGDPARVICRGASVEPGVVFDVRAGAVVLQEGVEVRHGTRLEGPVFAGPGTRIHGGFIRGCAFGPECRVHGELSATVFIGYDNKSHDGFVGHSVLGPWVNLGAGTITSNLKNTYGPVRLDVRRQPHRDGPARTSARCSAITRRPPSARCCPPARSCRPAPTSSARPRPSTCPHSPGAAAGDGAAQRGRISPHRRAGAGPAEGGVHRRSSGTRSGACMRGGRPDDALYALGSGSGGNCFAVASPKGRCCCSTPASAPARSSGGPDAWA